MSFESLRNAVIRFAPPPAIPIVFDDPRIEGVALGDMSRSFAAEYIVRGVDAVVHAAGLAHARADLPDAVYTAINVEATRKLAQAARAARVKHFVLMSSIRSQVGATHQGVITEATPAAPTDAYGRSKSAAEAVTSEALEGSRTRWTVLRPVLVYGPQVKGNMAALMRLAALPLPLPFGAWKSRRSLLSIGNLVAALRHILQTETWTAVLLSLRTTRRSRWPRSSVRCGMASAAEPCCFRFRKLRSRRRCV